MSNKIEQENGNYSAIYELMKQHPQNSTKTSSSLYPSLNDLGTSSSAPYNFSAENSFMNYDVSQLFPPSAPPLEDSEDTIAYPSLDEAKEKDKDEELENWVMMESQEPSEKTKQENLAKKTDAVSKQDLHQPSKGAYSWISYLNPLAYLPAKKPSPSLPEDIFISKLLKLNLDLPDETLESELSDLGLQLARDQYSEVKSLPQLKDRLKAYLLFLRRLHTKKDLETAPFVIHKVATDILNGHFFDLEFTQLIKMNKESFKTTGKLFSTEEDIIDLSLLKNFLKPTDILRNLLYKIFGDENAIEHMKDALQNKLHEPGVYDSLSINQLGTLQKALNWLHRNDTSFFK